jgi:S-adenosylmethionine hydrolase
MAKRKVFIVSDCTDIAINEIRCSIYQHTSLDSEFEIEPAINVEPFNLVHCSFQTRLIAEIAPPNSIIYVVCNPIQEQTERIIGLTSKSNLTFIGRNTGVFGWLTEDFGIKELLEINDPGFLPFGGKFIYPELIGKILSNSNISGETKNIEISKIRSTPIVESQILHIDNFGLLKINLFNIFFSLNNIQLDDTVELEINGTKIEVVYTNRMMDKKTGTWTIYKVSSLNGLLEVGKVRENGNKELKAIVGDIIKINSK